MVSFFQRPNVKKGFKQGARIVALLLPNDPIGLCVKIA